MRAPNNRGCLSDIIVRIIVDRHFNRLVCHEIAPVFFVESVLVIFGVAGDEHTPARETHAQRAMIFSFGSFSISSLRIEVCLECGI